MNPDFVKFFELSVDLLAIAGEDGYFKKLNPAWERCLGWTLNELCSRPYVEFVHPEDRASTSAEKERVASGVKTFSFLNRYRTKSGDYRWLKWSASSEGPVHYAVARDITEELKAADAHTDREHQLQSIASNVPGMLYRFRWSAAEGYSFTYVGPRSKGVFELESGDILQDPMAPINMIVAEDRPGFDAQLVEATEQAANFRWEGKIRTRSGRVKWVRVASDARQLVDGSILWDGVVEDVTRQKETEALLQEQQAKMVNSSKLASLGEMAGGVAHEINNPLAILKGYALQIRKLLEENPSDGTRVQEAVLRIEATVDRIARIVTGLRKVSRDSAHDSPVNYSMAELVNDTLSLCTERFRVHGIELAVNPIRPDWQLQCRPVEISQVLLNLLNNAHDAVEKTTERWIKLNVDEDGPYLRISVTDSGKGIPAPLRDKILMPFFTTKPVGRGTGLGLSISKSIVESHGGTLTLDVESPRTRFVVHLPKRGLSERP